MSLLQNSNAISAGGYDINNSLRFRSSASTYLNRTPASAGNRRTWTWSAWVKRGTLTTAVSLYLFEGTPGSGKENPIVFGEGGSSDKFSFYGWNGSGFDFNLKTTQVFRDISAWYHLVVAVDTTQATSSNRVKIYVNGNQISAFDASTYPSQNYDMAINNNIAHRIGTGVESSSRYFDGYMADINFIDGSQKAASDFGETDTTTGVWKPKAYTGTYGTNGFYLKFSDIATTSGSNAGLGKDFSGNSNYWTTNNISVTAGSTYDAMLDVPTNTSATVANYSTWNPLQKYSGLSAPTNGNLTIAGNSANWRSILSTFAVSSGKWYCEIVMTSVSSDALTGIFNINNASDLYDLTTVDNRQLGRYAGGYGYQNNGNKVNNNTGTSYGSTYTTSDIIGIAFDLDNGKIWFSKNGTWQASGDPAAGTNAAYTGLSGLFAVGMSTANGTFDANFGQRPFSYTPPTGYLALNTFNLPNPTILQGNKYMNAVLYTGNGSTNAITGVGFSPDFVWVKNRAIAEHNCLYDSVRGIYKQLYSNLTNAEDNATNSLLSFDSDGFTLGNNTTPNTNGNAHVAWNWRGSDSTAVSNTSGSTTSTVSVNTTAGFSIVTYTGTGANATVGHGLGVAPKMIIIKNRGVGTAGNGEWQVYHDAIGNTKYLALNTTAAAATASNRWNNISPTSSVFTVATTGSVNDPSNTYVAYCWAAISGFSAFGSYTGNGSTDGTFVYTGFRPKFVMVKRTDTTGNWRLVDTVRGTFNATQYELYPNLSNAEGTATYDILSNGFKNRETSADYNASGGTYIYMAFAENPFKNALAR